MSRLTCLLLVCAAACGLSACGKAVSSNGDSTGGAPAAGLAQQTFAPVPPARGQVDQVNWNLFTGEPTSLDWVKAFNYSENEVTTNLCENLLQLTPDFKIAPALAKSYKAEPADAPTKYVLQLREGVKFTDGKPMTAEDVVYSLRRHLDPKVGSYFVDNYVYVKDIRQTGPMEVTIDMKRPDALFLEFLTLPIGGVGEKDYIEKAGADYGTPDGGVMCTGPFSLKKWNKGDSIVLQRNDQYWDTAHRAKAKQFTFRFLTDDASVTSAFTSGELDGGYDVPISSIGQLRSSSTGKFYSGAGLQTLDLAITSTKGGLKNQLVRQALQKVIDYAGINKAILQGTGSPIKTLVTPATFGYSKETFQQGLSQIPEPKQDIAAAKKLVQQAGGAPEPIVIAYRPTNQFYTQVLSSIQDTARQAGITIKLRGIPDSQYTNLFADPKARKGLDALITLNYTDLPDPLEFYVQVALPGVPQNFSGYDNPQVNQLLSDARAAGDADERAKLVVQAQAQIMKDVVWVPIVGVNTRLFMNNKITGAPSSFVYLYYPWARDVGAP